MENVQQPLIIITQCAQNDKIQKLKEPIDESQFSFELFCVRSKVNIFLVEPKLESKMSLSMSLHYSKYSTIINSL